MKLARYLKTIGVIEIVSTIIGLIAFIIQSVMSFTNFFEFIISFVAIAFFAPAFGIALYVLGDLVENQAETTKANNINNNPKTYDFRFTLSANGNFYIVRADTTANFKKHNIVIPSMYNGLPVIRIGDFAFIDCHSLTSISIKDGIEIIGERAFGGCKSLEKVYITDSITSIEAFAFQGCRSLKDVYYTGTKEQWDNINIDILNNELINATIHYNYEG